MKKLLSIVLIMVLCIGIIPNTASAAVKINKKSITLDVGETATLKISGTKGKVNWTSKICSNCFERWESNCKKRGTSHYNCKG